MKQDINCSICHSELLSIYTPVGTQRDTKITICSRCGLVQSRYLKDNSIKKKSISCDADWGNIRHGKKLRLRYNLNLINQVIDFNSINSVLDIGSNRGDFVKWARKKKTTLYLTAVEPDVSLIDYYDIVDDVIEDRIELVSLSRKFDFIYCSHTLEHLDLLYGSLCLISDLMHDKSYLFIEVPNLLNIRHDVNIVEEFFIDKHKYHFTPQSLVNVFVNFDLYPVVWKIDCYNIAIIFQKKSFGSLNDLCDFEETVDDTIKLVHDYRDRLYSNRQLLKKICNNKLNKFLQRQKVAFWGGTRVLDALIRYGDISKDNIYILVDTYLSEICSEISGINLFHPEMLKFYEPNVIFVLARSSQNSIVNLAHEMGFRWVITFDEIMEQARI